MKSKKLLFMLILVLTLCLGFVSCKKDDDNKPNPDDNNPPVETFEPVAIETIATTYKNNQAVQAEGVVYAVTANGFYLSDSANGHIFVVISDFKKDVAVGDKVQVTGKFGFAKNIIQIKDVTKYEKVSSGNSLLTIASESTIVAVNALASSERANYGKVVTLTGTISKDLTNMYALTDEQGNRVFFDSNSNESVLENFNGSRVTLNAVVYKYLLSDYVWTLSFGGSEADVTLAPLSFDFYKGEALNHINEVVAKNIYGAIELPSNHELFTDVKYTWSVDTNEYITISDNVATIIIDSVDHEVTLKVTISKGEESETVEYAITLKGIVEQTVAEFYANKPQVDDSVVIIKGTIVAFTRNQSLSTRTLILMDPTTKETLPVDFSKTGDYILNTSDEFKALKVGDEVVVTAQYSFNARPTIQCVSKIEVKSSGNTLAHNFEGAVVLNSKESYEALAENAYDYSGQLVKFENPFLNYSTSSTPADTNWVRIGHDDKGGDAGYKTEGTVRNWAFLIAAQNENLGSDSWHKNYDIPFINKGGVAFNLEIYAYCLYISDSYLAFIIPDQSAFGVAPADKVVMDIESNIPSSIEMGQINLLASHEFVTGAISWTSSHPAVIDPATGVVTEVNENTVVTLTATYVFEGETKELVFEVSVLAATSLSVSQLIATGIDNVSYKVEGVIVGFASDGNSVESRKGVILLDPTTGEFVLVDGLGILYGKDYPNYVDENGTTLAVGMKLTVTGVYGLNSAQIGNSGPEQIGRKHLDVSTTGKVVAGEVVEYTFKDEHITVVDSHEALEALVANGLPYGTVIKFVGTADAPIYFGGSSSTAPINYKVYMSNAVDNNGTKYGGKTFSFKADVNAANAGENWFSKYLALPEAFVAPKDGNLGRPVVGTVYGIVTHTTSTYYQMAIVNLDNWTALPEVEAVKTQLLESLESSVESGSTNFVLPTNTHLTGAIKWESLSDLINIETGVVGVVTSNTEVTLTASFSYNGIEEVITHTVTITAPLAADPLSVTALVALGVDTPSVKVKGIVMGFASDGNDVESRKGLILIDNATGQTVFLNNFEGATYPTYKDVNDTVIKVGDEVIVEGNYLVNTEAIGSAPAQTNRHNIEVTSISIAQSEVVINYHLDQALVIDSNDAATALFTDHSNLPYGKIIKVVATAENPVYIGGSSSKNPFNLKVYFTNAADNNGTKINGKTIALKSDVNAAITGSDTWFTDLFGIEGPFVGPKDGVLGYAFTGTLYFVLTHTTGTYYQCNLVNYAECTVTPLA